MPRKTQNRRSTKQLPVGEDNPSPDWEDGMWSEFGDMRSADIFTDLNPADKRAFALFRKILDDAFAVMEGPPAKRARVTNRKGPRARSTKKKPVSRKRATLKTPPARRVSTSR